MRTAVDHELVDSKVEVNTVRKGHGRPEISGVRCFVSGVEREADQYFRTYLVGGNSRGSGPVGRPVGKSFLFYLSSVPFL